jgi:hypothetical protein
MTWAIYIEDAAPGGTGEKQMYLWRVKLSREDAIAKIEEAMGTTDRIDIVHEEDTNG